MLLKQAFPHLHQVFFFLQPQRTCHANDGCQVVVSEIKIALIDHSLAAVVERNELMWLQIILCKCNETF